MKISNFGIKKMIPLTNEENNKTNLLLQKKKSLNINALMIKNIEMEINAILQISTVVVCYAWDMQFKLKHT